MRRIFIVLIMLAVALILTKGKFLLMKETSFEVNPKIAEIGLDPKKNNSVEEIQKKIDSPKTMSAEFRKCFKRDSKDENLDSIASALRHRRDFSPEVVNEENYELLTPDQKNLVVQVFGQEEDKNRVRVFEISKGDGLPDRVKDFPEINSPVESRIHGALSLGKIKSKSVSSTQVAYDGSSLSLDRKDDKIIRIHFMAEGFDFECKNQSCLCLTKEK